MRNFKLVAKLPESPIAITVFKDRVIAIMPQGPPLLVTPEGKVEELKPE